MATARTLVMVALSTAGLSGSGCTVILGCPTTAIDADTDLAAPFVAGPPTTTQASGTSTSSGDTARPDDEVVFNGFALSAQIVWDQEAQAISTATWDSYEYRSYFQLDFYDFDPSTFAFRDETCSVVVFLDDATPAGWAASDEGVYFGVNKLPDEVESDCVGYAFAPELEGVAGGATVTEVGVGFGAPSANLLSLLDAGGYPLPDEFTIGGYYQVPILGLRDFSDALGTAIRLDADLEVVEDNSGNAIPIPLENVRNGTTVRTAAYLTESYYFYYF